MNFIKKIIPVISQYAMDIGIKIIGAFVLWVVGRMVIGWIMKAISKALDRQQFEATLVKYMTNIANVAFNILLALSILSIFGVQTATFASILAAAGVAIGLAWSGLLANFAAGVFMVIFRPFKVGDFITAGGTTGTVREIGLFVTTIDTMDNVCTIIGNNKIFSSTIQNFSTNPHRRVELVAQLNHSVDPREAIERLKNRLAQIPEAKKDPAPEVYILEFNLAGPVLCVRPYCTQDDYWTVYFATNDIIRDEFSQAGYPVPEMHRALRAVPGTNVSVNLATSAFQITSFFWGP